MKILVVTANTFQRYSGGGISNLNLFKNINPSDLANVHKDEFIPDKSYCSNYFKLSNKEMGWGFPINIFYNIYKLLFVKKSKNVLITDINKNNSNPKSKDTIKALKKFINFFGLEGFGERINISAELFKFLVDFKPDVIHSSLGDLGYVRLVKQISALFNIPVIVHITDDWPDSSYKHGFSKIFRKSMEKELLELMTQAKLRYAICQEMADDYFIRYNLKFDTIISPIDSKEWLPFSKSDYYSKNPFVIRYLGTIHPLCQKNGLLEVAKAISELNSEDYKIVFEIYTPVVFVSELEKEVRNYPVVSVKSAPPNNEAPQLLASADLLVIPVNFDDYSFKYNKYSLPAKTFAYMISGTPVLLYGPPKVPHVAYAKRDKWGFVVDTDSYEYLKKGIKELYSNEQLRKKLGTLAKNLAVKNHDGDIVREKFHSKIKNIINQ